MKPDSKRRAINEPVPVNGSNIVMVSSSIDLPNSVFSTCWTEFIIKSTISIGVYTIPCFVALLLSAPLKNESYMVLMNSCFSSGFVI